VSSMWSTPKRVQPWLAWFSSCINGTCRCLFFGWLCLLALPCSCAALRATAGNAAAVAVFPCWLAFLLRVPPQVYLHELQDTGSEPET